MQLKHFSFASPPSTGSKCLQRMNTLVTVFDSFSKFQHITRLACAAAECICSLAVCTILQMHLFQAGIIWQLVPLLFQYDYTLDEGGKIFLCFSKYIPIA